MAATVGAEVVVIGWNTPGFMSSDRVKNALAGIRGRHPNTGFYATPVTALSFPPESFDFMMMHTSITTPIGRAPASGCRGSIRTRSGRRCGARRSGAPWSQSSTMSAPPARSRARMWRRPAASTRPSSAPTLGAPLRARCGERPAPQAVDDRAVSVSGRAIRGQTDRGVYRFSKPGR